MMEEKLYTCEEVAARYRVKITTVWKWVRQKKLPAIVIGRNYRISEKALSALDKRQAVR